MNNNKLRDLFSKMSFTAIVVVWLVVAAGLLAGLWHPIEGYFALDKPTLEIGKGNAIPIIDALEMYKVDHGFYPQIFYETSKYNPVVLDYRYDYDYEAYSTKGAPQEYMLSFRKRWTVSGWYCYYSGDREWRQSMSTCWSSPRPTHNPAQ